MPKRGAEPKRRAELINSTIAVLGQQGSLDVTVKEIAAHAGMSSALAHHYFGGKDDIFNEAMEHILNQLKQDVWIAIRAANTPRDKIHGIAEACFAPASFRDGTVTAWMLFYAFACSNDRARAMLRVYHKRLRRHLSIYLNQVPGAKRSDAELIASAIDGAYLRAAFRSPDKFLIGRDEAMAQVRELIDLLLTGRA